MIELDGNTLTARFPQVHRKASCSITFQRTLRVPDDNQEYPLPAGLGDFPLFAVDDYEVPPAWKRHGGVFFPMHSAEAMWVSIRHGGYPMAIKIAAGKINAVNGKPWSSTLDTADQDYVVSGLQPWLDGFSVERDVVRQFVAMPLGEGVTAEEQITGEAQWGGLQIMFFPMKAERYEELQKQHHSLMMEYDPNVSYSILMEERCDMGFAPGGRIRQEIAEDTYGADAWDTSVSARCFVHLLHVDAFTRVTGLPTPPSPITADTYELHGVPWFTHYQSGPTLGGSKTLAKLDGLASALGKKGKKLTGNKPITVGHTIALGSGKPLVREGEF